ncbi:MAG: N-acetyl-gamma-glutamyl-phosphate reductase [Alphaproteobacteria bacterium]|nr:N-acetyl-gamma-glutamyl-phosphate reductase [Alphaproteobacteria bacterium]
MASIANAVRVGILGASGYTGAELVRLLARHSGYSIRLLTADRKAGSTMDEVFPHLAGLGLPPLISIDQANWSDVDAIFCALPHATTQEVIAKLPRTLKVVDLSADFRLADVASYAKWYGHAHKAPELQKEAVYGLPEIERTAIRKARLVASPGCYPTSAILPLAPLIEAKQIDADDIVIDSKSGVSGAGRAAKEDKLFTEVSEAIHPYGIASHRHAPEIEQSLSKAAGRPIVVNFTPHLMPMNRGILSTIYVRLAGGAKASDLRATLATKYKSEAFVRVLPEGVVPATRHVRGSNLCLIGVFEDRVKGRAILCSVIDNLVKGASGQAIQNMNLVCDLPEASGLEQAPLFP